MVQKMGETRLFVEKKYKKIQIKYVKPMWEYVTYFKKILKWRGFEQVEIIVFYR